MYVKAHYFIKSMVIAVKSKTKGVNFFSNEVIPLYIDSIYSLHYIYFSQHIYNKSIG